MDRMLVWGAAVWAVAWLAVQLGQAWGGGRRDHSRATGSGLRGLVYNFTGAMLPGHKETAAGRPLEFAVGMTLHAGVAAAALALGLWLIERPAGGALLMGLRAAAALGLLAALVLLVRRALSPMLRAMSHPDDYASAALTALFLAAAALGAGTSRQPLFTLAAVLLLFYLPLGKLRHALFFYAARADFGRRLGRRGVYPPQGRRAHG